MKKIVVILCIVFVLCILLLIMPSAAANVTATVSPSSVAQGHNIFINGTADGQPSSVAIWILGKNFALKQTVAVNVDGSFSFEIMQDTTNSMYSGQYFVVVQHSGMNGLYDIDWAGGTAQYVFDYAAGPTQPVSLFKIYGPGSLQGFDAVEALEQGINQPSVDDNYTALQFQIVSSSKIGIYNDGRWYRDMDGSGTWNTGDEVNLFGAPGWIPIVGDWNATGKSYIGVTNGQQWYLDWNGNGAWDGADRAYNFGAPGWIPKIGDWNGDGRTKIGVTNGQQWYLDTNGNGLWDIMGIDYAYSFGAPGWTPVVGKWS